MPRLSKPGSYQPRKAGKALSVRERVAAYRKRMRAKGYKPVEVWVPDMSNPRFIARLKRQARAVARREGRDKKLAAWLDANMVDAVRMIEEEERAAGVPPPEWDPASERPI